MKAPTISDFDALVDQYTREIFAFLWRFLRDRQDAEDALQETFLRAFSGFPRLRDHANLRAWLYKIATNVAYTQVERRNRRNARITDITEFTFLSSSDNHAQGDLLTTVLQAVDRLPPKQQSALLLRNYQGLSYEEIGSALDCSPESARANVYQALKKLRSEFTEVEND